MRHILISVLVLGLVSACSSAKLGPHRIDVQQGNALDQENVARLKTGLNRSQVRFLLGTPLVVDPFRNDRWDYVYVNYKAGKLAEQKRISLFFDGDTLVRIAGDVPPPEPAPADAAPAAESKVESRVEPVASPRVEATPLAHSAAPKAEPIPAAQASGTSETSASGTGQATKPASQTSTPRTSDGASTALASEPSVMKTSVVAPLPSPQGAPAYHDPRASAPLAPATEADEAVLAAVRNWAQAWSSRDADAYLAAYDIDYVPPGDGTRSDWEKRRRMLLGASGEVDVKIESPVVKRLPDGTAVVTFNQYYQSDSHRDVVAKQLRLAERQGRWLIIEEKALSPVRGDAQ